MKIAKKTTLKELAGIVAKKMREHDLDFVKDRLASFYYWNDWPGIRSSHHGMAKTKIELKSY